ncbi:MAG: membrane protein FxsA [Gammaproteobacteria bacterium]|nr:membrane protein FxsA [Gammaproteobacteria bacterium]
MLRIWPILFIVVPLVELYLIIEVGSLIGALWTVLLVVLTAVIGVSLLRIQGFNTLNRARQNMEMGALPAMEMMEGMMLAVGGALLITPGFITDTLGFLCLVPATRRAMIRYLMRRSSMQAGFYSHRTTHYKGDHQQENHQGRTIEGEYHRDD